jgi:uncharacterized protein YkwD
MRDAYVMARGASERMNRKIGRSEGEIVMNSSPFRSSDLSVSPLLAASLLVAAAACGNGGGHARDAHDGETTRTIVEKTPNGTRTTTITTRTVEAPPPPARPADPMPGDALVRHNVERLNQYRSAHGAAPLVYDAKISAFAYEGSRQLSRDHSPHAHFAAHSEGAPGFGTHTAENQGDPNGVPPQGGDRVASGKRQIDILLKLMMDEGPGGGHYENMINRKYRRIGIGLYEENGVLYLTNDFSD